MIRTPIPGIGKAWADEGVANCQIIGPEFFAAPDHGAHLELALFYIWEIRTTVFDPIEEIPFASAFVKRS